MLVLFKFLLTIILWTGFVIFMAWMVLAFVHFIKIYYDAYRNRRK